MNARVLELIKNPKLFQPKDLELLNVEIDRHPYIQSFRALQLYGTHLFEPESYHQKLSETAAFTTDKKILYRLINQIKEEKTEAVSTLEQVVTHDNNFVQPKNEETEPALKTSEKPEETIVENQLEELKSSPEIVANQDLPKIDKSVEDKQTTAQENVSNEDVISFSEADDAENFTKEQQIEETQISDKKDIIEHPSQLSFSATDEFLSEVKIPAGKAENQHFEKPKSEPNRHEIEMQKLIAEVEAKMKSSQKEKEPVETTDDSAHQNFGVNFAETDSFLPEINTEEKVLSASNSDKTENEENLEKIIEIEQKTSDFDQNQPEIIEKSTETQTRNWKPMTFSGNTPDSLIQNKEKLKAETEIPTEKPKENIVNSEQKVSQEELPVINVSFFGEQVAPIETDEDAEMVKEESLPEEKSSEPEKSNIPVFINTWQNWLKIDRNQSVPEEKPSISITEIKNKVIDTFIENEPKISKLKEDSDFVVKEKSDDISHLMTETLARLYTEQKLYSKAIKAYEILTGKFPEKKSLFEEKIKEIKELRQNK